MPAGGSPGVRFVALLPGRRADDTLDVLLAATRDLRDARAALVDADTAADADAERASIRATQLLARVEDRLGALTSPGAPAAGPSATRVRADVGRYVLAADTLRRTGIACRVVADLLRRGAEAAERGLVLLRAAAS